MMLVWWIGGFAVVFAINGLLERLAKTRPWLSKLGGNIFNAIWAIYLFAITAWVLSSCMSNRHHDHAGYLGCEQVDGPSEDCH